MKRDKNAPDYLETLVHEMTHVWQFQNGGTAYQAQSLTAQGENPNNGAYEWQAAMQAGKVMERAQPGGAGGADRGLVTPPACWATRRAPRRSPAMAPSLAPRLGTCNAAGRSSRPTQARRRRPGPGTRGHR